MKKAQRPEPKFKKGDRVRVSRDCLIIEHRGRETLVRRVWWDEGGGGQPAGYVCEVDIPFTGTAFRTFWEHLLEKA